MRNNNNNNRLEIIIFFIKSFTFNSKTKEVKGEIERKE